MDNATKKLVTQNLKRHPIEKTCFLSRFLFCWQLPIFVKGWKNEITEDDLYKPLHDHKSTPLADALERSWSDEENFSKNPSLCKVLLKLFGAEFAFYAFFVFMIEIGVIAIVPLAINKLMDFFTPNQLEISEHQAYMYAVLVVVASTMRLLCFHCVQLAMNVLGMKLRIACSSLIYRRALTLKKTDLAKITVGSIVNLLANDVTRFNLVFSFLPFVFLAPVELIAGIYFIDAALGHAAVVGVVVIFVCLFVQLLALMEIAPTRLRVALRTDHRIRLMNDIVTGIQAIKMYTWEKPFGGLVQEARRLELHHVGRANWMRLSLNTFRIYIAELCVFFVVLAQILGGKTLTSRYVYTVVNLYGILKLSTAVALPIALTELFEAFISVRRIQEFLLHDRNTRISPQTIQTCILRSYDRSKEKSVGVSMENVSVKWGETLGWVLNNAEFKAGAGEVVGVVGESGCGKTTLLQLILGEIQASKGQVSVGGSISYAAQEAWIFSSSIRQNILFGEEFESDKYARVLEVCALTHDLSVLPFGDQTLVGERGVMLSGGQKARINLARAVYRNCDIYLLDDPLAAVDAHVAFQIFNMCVLTYLKDKCVILVSNQMQLVQNLSKVYVLNRGRIECTLCGDQITNTHQLSKSYVAKDEELASEVKEHRSEGVMVVKNLQRYSQAGHWLLSCLTFGLVLFSHVSENILHYFLAFWVNLEQGVVTTTVDFLTTRNCLEIYAVLAVVFVLLAHVASTCFVFFCRRASTTLHANMLSRILTTPMTFFNHHSSGRILNRFAKDLGSVDETLPVAVMNATTGILTLLGNLVLVMVANYWMTIPTGFLLVAIGILSVLFRPTNRNITRTEAITKSAVFSYVGGSLQGLTTIRAFKAERILSEEFDQHQDFHNSAYYMYAATFSAFGFWSDMACAFYNAVIIFGFFLMSGTSVGSIGLAISQATSLLGVIQYVMRTLAYLDSEITSIERVVEYSELDKEPDEGVVPKKSWPQVGGIEFKSVSLSYGSSSLVLKGVSFGVEPGEKVGVVGRTGAGKTSLISALFRLFDFDGIITIDEIDTKTISLNVLRSKITIIPQDPVLYLGTIRTNLDPFTEFDDAKIWNLLEEFGLKTMLSLGLESTVEEGGSNFSVGQRQLLCLVRALLRNNKIIVLDEATANVDPKTDELIQTIIRKKFRDCTVLTIAHRLHTVMDSDKILVMDRGQVVEFGAPRDLLQNRDGFFHSYAELLA